MPAVIPLVELGVSVAAAAYSVNAQKHAASNAADVDQATADYNAKYDTAAAQQLDLDTLQNIRTARQEDAVYLSRQASSYAAAGVLATTGSPLHAQITNAGRMEQQIQQQYVNSMQQQQSYYAAAQVGQLEGGASASADRTQGSLALINGGAKIAGQAFGAYNSGQFAGLFGGTQYTDISVGDIEE